jgi:hypothetical protein
MYSLKLTLTLARIFGRREYHGDILAAGTWPTIITTDASDHLHALLARPERRTNSVSEITLALRASFQRNLHIA